MVNDEQQLKEIKSGLQFAASYEEMRHAVKQNKATIAAAKKAQAELAAKKRKLLLAKKKAEKGKEYRKVLQKLGLSASDQVTQKDVDRLTGAQLKVSYNNILTLIIT